MNTDFNLSLAHDLLFLGQQQREDLAVAKKLVQDVEKDLRIWPSRQQAMKEVMERLEDRYQHLYFAERLLLRNWEEIGTDKPSDIQRLTRHLLYTDRPMLTLPDIHGFRAALVAYEVVLFSQVVHYRERVEGFERVVRWVSLIAVAIFILFIAIAIITGH